jgi:hypothetical protein
LSTLSRNLLLIVVLILGIGWVTSTVPGLSWASSIGQAGIAAIDPCTATFSSTPSGLHCNTVTAQESDIIHMDTVPFVLVPAPGAGLVLFPISVRWKFNFVSQPYQEPDVGGPYLYWQNNTNAFSYLTWGTINSGNFSLFNFATLTQTQAQYGAGVYMAELGLSAPPADYANQPLVTQTAPGDSLNRGPILTAVPNAAGTGYAVGDQVVTNAGSFTGNYGLFTVATLSGSGAASLTISAAGTLGLAGTGLTTYNVGNVSSATITAGHGGTGYAVNDTGNITGCGDGNANYKVTTESGGVVSAVSIIAAQSGTTYTTTTGCTTTHTSGSGSGLELNVAAAGGSGLTVNTTAQTGDGTLTVTLWYTVAPQ